MAAKIPRPRILLFGPSGQIGRALPATLMAVGEVIPVDRSGADFAHPESLRPVVRRHRPQIIVNAAAFTAVDRAETEARLAENVNEEAPRVLAEEAEALEACLVHYSTDYVFDGRKPTPYLETDDPHPLSTYGRTKLQGERAVAAGCKRYLTLRTSWVFAANGTNFLRTVLRLAAERESLRIVDDQRGAPTSATLLAAATAQLLSAMFGADADDPRWGLYHLTASGDTNWYRYAQYIIARARGAGAPLLTSSDTVTPIASTAYPTAAQRPANSRLDTGKVRSTFGVPLPDWQQGVDQVLDQMAFGHHA